MAMKIFLGKRSVKEDILSFDAHHILSTPGVSVCVCSRPLVSFAMCLHRVQHQAGVGGGRSSHFSVRLTHSHRPVGAAGLEAKLERLMASKGSSFEKEVAYRASQAAGGHVGCAVCTQTHVSGDSGGVRLMQQVITLPASFLTSRSTPLYEPFLHTHPGPLAVWVVANLHYSRVLKQIAPLEGQLNHIKGELSESQGRLQQCQEELLALDEQVCVYVCFCSVGVLLGVCA